MGANVWERQQAQQYLDGRHPRLEHLRGVGFNSEVVDEAYVPFFGVLGTAWAHTLAPLLAMLWPERMQQSSVVRRR